MIKVVYTIKAENEYNEAIDWYENESPGMGVLFIQSIQNEIEWIRKNPLLYPLKRKIFREAILHKYPFSIVYIYKPKLSLIKIAAIYHAKRRPGGKYRRT